MGRFQSTYVGRTTVADDRVGRFVTATPTGDGSVRIVVEHNGDEQVLTLTLPEVEAVYRAAQGAH